ncbi:MAG: hypothetical protein K6F63_02180 [Lachnospiraceae bacterium]|nr:hypothetical protein [Lachnospiraceae bacterium]
MIGLFDDLNKRINLLTAAIKKAENEEKTFPEGGLRISVTSGRCRYYKVTSESGHLGKYISKKETKLLGLLAQKSYNKEFLKNAYKELKLLKKTYAYLTDSSVEKIYARQIPGRKILIKPYIIPDDMYVREWERKKFKTNEFMIENRVYATRRGDDVRSKSEAILADLLFELDIPYHYEAALYLNNGQVKYPDFTLLNKKTREEIFLEHFGLLDDESYRRNALRKVVEYESAGIYLGKNLLITYETGEFPLDIKKIRKMLKEILC